MKKKVNRDHSKDRDDDISSILQNIRMEQLLDREPVKFDKSRLEGYLKNKVILVTGAGGSIGSELCRQIAGFGPKKLLLLGHGENSISVIARELRQSYVQVNLITIIADIKDRGRLDDVFSFHRPQIVFHAAAHKHVPLMELNPSEAVKNNVWGTLNVAECAQLYGTECFVLISSDKAVNPTNVMGATKRLAECIVQQMSLVGGTRFITVRFGNVLGSRESVVLLFKEQILKGGPITVTHTDMVRYFMTIPEAIHLLIQATTIAKGGEIFILDMGKPVKITELACKLIRLAGLIPEKDIPIVYTGIRPGEKLSEQLISEEEELCITEHERIYKCTPAKAMRGYTEIVNELSNILARHHSVMMADEMIDKIKKLKELLP